MRVETPYAGGTYHVVPLAVVHPEGKEEANDATTATHDATTAAGSS